LRSLACLLFCHPLSTLTLPKSFYTLVALVSNMSVHTFLQRPARGEPFKSAGEAQIARCLDRYGIPYRYEAPLAVLDRDKVRIWYPDFQLAGYGVLIEYAGVRENPDYERTLERKKSVYRANGLDALVVGPDFFSGDWPSRLLDQVEEVLGRRLEALRAARRTQTAWSPASGAGAD